MKRLWLHLRTLWPGWTILAPLPFLAHAAWALSRHAFGWENAGVIVLVLGLFAVGPRTKRLLLGAYPIGLVGLLYDAMRVVKNVGVTGGTVHLCDLRAIEITLFGVKMNGQRGTLHDWFQAHPSPVLDGLCAIPYGTFIFVSFACAIWLYIRDYPRMVRFAWCFFALNVCGFVTYHLYPAAPPWYFHAHGCTVDILTHASEGPALDRIDARLGIHYFAAMYGRSSSVFGAMPSLHCAYPLLVLLEGWAAFSPAWRYVSAGFFALMCFAAVYLDHHWVLDAVAGVLYCLAVVAAARALARWRASRAAAIDRATP